MDRATTAGYIPAVSTKRFHWRLCVLLLPDVAGLFQRLAGFLVDDEINRSA